MKSMLKVLLWIVGGLVALVLVAAVAVPLLFDPNDFKDELAAQVQSRTGRTFRIEGDIGLSVFPWLGLEVGRVALGNAPGFEAPVFASAESLDIQVRLLPLLERRVETDTLTLQGLVLNLARDEAGRGNWEDLVAPATGAEAPAAPAAPAEAPGLAGLAVGGVALRDARVDWDDRSTGQRYTVEALSLETGAIVAGEPVALRGAFRVRGGTPPLEGEVSLSGSVTPDLEAQRHTVEDLVLDLRATGEAVGGGPVKITLRGAALADAGAQRYRLQPLHLAAGLPGAAGKTLELDLAAAVQVDLAAGTLTVDGLVAEAAGLRLEGELSGQGLPDQPQLGGALRIPAFAVAELFQALGQPVPATADPAVLDRARLSTRLSLDPGRAVLEDLELVLDESTLRGRVEVREFSNPRIAFELDLDAIDVDRYLPPAPAGEAPAPQTAGSATASAAASGELPLETLRGLRLDGRLGVGRLTVGGLTATELAAPVSAAGGLIRLSPLSARLYEGLYRGNVTLDARGEAPRLAVDEQLAGVQAGPLLADLMGEDRLLGTAEVSARLTMRGADATSIRRSLDGEASFAFTDGAVRGINIGRLIREARARLRGEALPAGGEPVQTDFTSLTGSVRFTDGVGRNDDLSLKSPLLRVSGQGSVDLGAERVDYGISAAVVATAKGQGGEDLGRMEGVEVPIRIRGPLAGPSVSLDVEALLQGQAERLAKEKAEELRRKVEERVQEKVQEQLGEKLDEKLQEELKGRAGEVLKGLFGN